MLIAAISTLALALAIGPQVQLGLQAVLEQVQPAVESQDEPVAETVEAVEIPASSIPAAAPADPVIIEDDFEETVIEALEETPSVPQVILAEASPQDTAPDAIEETTVAEPEAAAEPQSGEVPQAEWNGILEGASAALAAAKTAKGNFIQTNPDGSIVEGTFALNRPGRMRFDYDDPTPVLIVSDGITVAMEDSELETVDRVPIGATPLGLILSTDLRVGEDVEVLSVLQNADRYGIRAEDARGELEGTLTMVFDKSTFELLGWLATDGNLQNTVVDLIDVETNVRVDPRLFRLDEAEDEEEER